MSTPATDYNHQLLAYLQTWRQLLEQWTTMSAGLPLMTSPFGMPIAPPGGQFMPPMAPFMPPMPPTPATAPVPPAPADYTQQLFSYLQAWRRYLEQMAGAIPGSPQASTAQPPTAQPADTSESYPDVPIPPYRGEGGTKASPETAVRKDSDDPTWPLVLRSPESGEGGSQLPHRSRPGPANLFNRKRAEPEVLTPPDYGFGYRVGLRPDPEGPVISSSSRYTPEAPAQRAVGTPFRSVISRVERNPSPQLPKSLFSKAAVQRAPAPFREAGQTPSP